MRSGFQPVPLGLPEKPETRHRRQDEVERVLRPCAMRDGIRERADGLEQLEHRAGPTMRHDQRQGVRVTRADVDEVNVEPVDLGHELRERVQLRFCLSPVVLGAPVADELLQFRELYALRPVIDRLPVRPSRRSNASAEIHELLFRNVDAEGADRVVRRCDRLTLKQTDSTEGR